MPLLIVDGSFLSLALVAVVATGAGFVVGRRLTNRPERRNRQVSPAVDADFFHQIRDAALITENGVIVGANSAATEHFGYPSLIGLSVTKLVPTPADGQEFLRSILRGPVIDHAMRLRRSDGAVREFLVTATARFNAQGAMIGCQGLARDVTEQNRGTASLRQAEQDYRGLFEHAYDAILILDLSDERILDVNEQACRLYGFSREDFIGRSMVELSVNPGWGKKLVRRTREQDGRYAAFVSRQMKSDGTNIDVEITAAKVSYKGTTAILSINRDISVRRRAEDATRASEARFRLLIESVTDYAMVMLNPEGLVESWNEGAERITGYAEGETVGQSAAMFAPPEERHLFALQRAIALAEGRFEQQVKRMRKDGSHFEALLTLTRILDGNGSLRGFASVTHDITASVELEQARQEILHVLKKVAFEWTETFDAVQVPIVLLDTEGRIRRLNRAAQALAGIALKELVDRPVAQLSGEPWVTVARVGRDALLQGKGGDARVTNGESVWQVSSSVAGTFPAAARAIVIAYDLTHVTRLETSLRQSEMTAALGSLVAGVAHEVRNPLFTISATLDAWEARYGSSEGVLRYGESLRQQVERMSGLMHDLLEYGKPTPLLLGEASLLDVIRTAAADCSAIAAKHEVDITIAVDDMPAVLVDATRLEQVFQNLIDNAIRHSPRGAEVRVGARVEETGVVCRVFDQGSGIGSEDPEQLFMPFHTRRRGGTGLGLSIARKIVALHRGAIVLANHESHGAVATVRLPLSILEASSGEEESLQATGTGR